MSDSSLSRRSFLAGASALFATAANANLVGDPVPNAQAADYPLTYGPDPVGGYTPTRIPAMVYKYNGEQPPGTISVNLADRKLYLAQGKEMIQYPIAVGRVGTSISHDAFVIDREVYWPTYSPTPNTLKRRPNLRTCYSGGEDNPHGVVKFYLNIPTVNANGEIIPGAATFYGIHGTDDENTIGTQASAGCFRMFNRHAYDLSLRIDPNDHNLVLIDHQPGLPIGAYGTPVPYRFVPERNDFPSEALAIRC